MQSELEKYTRQELESKLMHVINMIAYRLGAEWMTITEPDAKITRTPEAERENAKAVLENMMLARPLWEMIEQTHPSYDILRPWLELNKDKLPTCICSGCKKKPKATKALWVNSAIYIHGRGPFERYRYPAQISTIRHFLLGSNPLSQKAYFLYLDYSPIP